MLNHSAGLEYFFPEKPTFLNLCDKDYILRCLEEASPLASSKPDRSSFHIFSFGWILGGLIEKVCGKSLNEMVEEMIVKPLGLEGELVMSPIPTHYQNNKEYCIANTEALLPEAMMEAHTAKTKKLGGLDLIKVVDLLMGDADEEQKNGVKDLLSGQFKGKEYLIDPR